MKLFDSSIGDYPDLLSSQRRMQREREFTFVAFDAKSIITFRTGQQFIFQPLLMLDNRYGKKAAVPES